MYSLHSSCSLHFFSATTKKTQNSLWLLLICASKLRARFLVWHKIPLALCIFLVQRPTSNVFLRPLKPLKPLKPLESLESLSALCCPFCPFQNRRPRHSVAPPLTQRGTCTGPCTQFRPPLPTSPIVGEGYLVGLPKVGKRADLPTTQNGLWPLTCRRPFAESSRHSARPVAVGHCDQSGGRSRL